MVLRKGVRKRERNTTRSITCKRDKYGHYRHMSVMKIRKKYLLYLVSCIRIMLIG